MTGQCEGVQKLHYMEIGTATFGLLVNVIGYDRSYMKGVQKLCYMEISSASIRTACKCNRR